MASTAQGLYGPNEDHWIFSVVACVHESLVDHGMRVAHFESVLKLKPAERMRLLNVIHRRLEQPDVTIDDIWYDEAERRLASLMVLKFLERVQKAMPETKF